MFGFFSCQCLFQRKAGSYLFTYIVYFHLMKVIVSVCSMYVNSTLFEVCCNRDILIDIIYYCACEIMKVPASTSADYNCHYFDGCVWVCFGMY